MPDNEPTRSAPDPSTASYGGAPHAPTRDFSNGTDGPQAAIGTRAQTPDEVAAAAASSAGVADVIPCYEILGELGRGGMGVVYRARDTRLNRDVALKMILRADASRMTVARFWAEAEVMAAVKHPNVVQVYELGEHGGRPYMAMEFVAGGSLQKRLAHGPFPPRETAALVARIARGVGAAHELGIVHRDLKPGNVLLAAEDSPKVSDFGLAKRLAHSLTQTQALMGTPAYMAPEQAAAKAKFVGPPADVWALGVILYECVAGKRPFEADTVEVLLAQIRTAEPRPLHAPGGAAPRDIDTIVSACLAKEPEHRYPTAAELAADLERFLRGEPISVRPIGALERGYKWVKRNKVVSGAGAAVALALLVGSGVSLGFALEAQERAEEAKKKQKEADDAAAGERAAANRAADAARTAAREAQNAVQTRGELETVLATALRRPAPVLQRNAPLTPDEVESLWELAARRNTPVAERFLAEATDTPRACDQLNCRGPFMFHAAIGLNPALRAWVDRLVLARLTDPKTALEHRVRLALAYSRWEASPGGAGAAAIDALFEATVRMAKEMHSLERNDEIRAEKNAPGVNIAPEVSMLKRDTFSSWRVFAEGVASIAPNLPPEVAIAKCDRTAQAMTEFDVALLPGPNVDNMAGAAAAVAVHATPEKAVTFVRDSILMTRSPGTLRALAAAMRSVGLRLTPEQAARAAKQLGADLERATDPDERSALAGALTAVIPSLPPEQRSSFSAAVGAADAKTAEELTAELNKIAAKDFDKFYDLAVRWGEVARRLPADRAAKGRAAFTEMFLRVCQWGSVPIRLGGQAKGFSSYTIEGPPPHFLPALAGALDAVRRPAATDRRTREYTAFEQMLQSWTLMASNPAALREFAPAMVTVAHRLPPERAAQFYTRVANRFDNTSDKLNTVSPTNAPTVGALRALAGCGERPTFRTACRLIDVLPLAVGCDDWRRLSDDFHRSVTGTAHPDTAFRQNARPLAAPPDLIASLPLLHPSLHPQAQPLPAQELVELLKHPFCVSEARRAVLDALEFTYKRSFKDQWEFVEFVQRNNVHDHTTGKPLDLLTPPKRPEPKP